MQQRRQSELQQHLAQQDAAAQAAQARSAFLYSAACHLDLHLQSKWWATRLTMGGASLGTLTAVISKGFFRVKLRFRTSTALKSFMLQLFSTLLLT